MVKPLVLLYMYMYQYLYITHTQEVYSVFRTFNSFSYMYM